jgi:hypothetical protein
VQGKTHALIGNLALLALTHHIAPGLGGRLGGAGPERVSAANLSDL